jgi:hypothetical protein
MVDDINPFWFSAHGAKEDRFASTDGMSAYSKSIMGHLRARDVLFDGMVDYSRVELF